MTRTDSTSGTTPRAPGPGGRPCGLLVMRLVAAEQHVLVVLGEADLHTARPLRDQLVEMLPGPPLSVLVELAGLEFCDLAGLDALHDACRAAQHAGVTLTFRGMSERLSWLHRTFPPRGPAPQPSAGRSARVEPTAAAAERSTSGTAPAAGAPLAAVRGARPAADPDSCRTPPASSARVMPRHARLVGSCVQHAPPAHVVRIPRDGVGTG